MSNERDLKQPRPMMERMRRLWKGGAAEPSSELVERVDPPELVEPDVVASNENNNEISVTEINMSIELDGLEEIGGFIGGCLVDSDTGLMLGSIGGDNFDLEAAGAMNTSVVKAKLAAIETLGLDDTIEDILITLGKQYHLIRPLAANPAVFLYVALDKKGANLGMARILVKKVEGGIAL